VSDVQHGLLIDVLQSVAMLSRGSTAQICVGSVVAAACYWKDNIA